MVNLQFVSSVDSEMTHPLSALEMQIFKLKKKWKTSSSYVR